jgi:hypothetical protein
VAGRGRLAISRREGQRANDPLVHSKGRGFDRESMATNTPLKWFMAVLILSACGQDDRSYLEYLAAKKEACDKLGGKWVKDGNHWKCWGI